MNKGKKVFDSVQMTREIRDAIYRQNTDPKFDPKEFAKIKAKWTRLLELQEQGKTIPKTPVF